jgi:hypothetical protein
MPIIVLERRKTCATAVLPEFRFLIRFPIFRKNDPFLICAEQWLRAVVPDRHTFFEARWALQKLIRLMRQSTDVPPNAESSDSLC